MFCQSVPVSASISVGYETLRMRSQDSAQCPSKTIMHYTMYSAHTYVYMLVGLHVGLHGWSTWWSTCGSTCWSTWWEPR